MITLAYIDSRPLIFLIGLPIFIGVAFLICRVAALQATRKSIVIYSISAFVILFILLLTGYGPFVDQKESREYLMTWEIMPSPSRGMKEAEIVFNFVDYPGNHTGIYSDQLADHLRAHGSKQIKVVFEVTSDYGKVRGFHETEIAGLKSWKSEWGYAGSRGSPDKSPWN